MSGINIINSYSSNIFDEIAKKGAVSALTPSQQNLYIGLSGFTGAAFAGMTVSALSRRMIFIGGHVVMGFLLFLVALFIDLGDPNLTLMCICLFIVVFQCTNGGGFFLYVSEIASDTALGLSLMVLMSTLSLQSLTSLKIISSFGIDTFFYFFAAFQVVTIATLSIYMKETKGLSAQEKRDQFKLKEQ